MLHRPSRTTLSEVSQPASVIFAGIGVFLSVSDYLFLWDVCSHIEDVTGGLGCCSK
jgi:hypothetical protein